MMWIWIFVCVFADITFRSQHVYLLSFPHAQTQMRQKVFMFSAPLVTTLIILQKDIHLSTLLTLAKYKTNETMVNDSIVSVVSSF